MKGNAQYFALACGGVLLFVLGFAVGRTGNTPQAVVAPVEQQNAVADDEQEQLAEIIAVLKRPEARQIMDALAASKNKEIELVTGRSRSSIAVQGRSLFTSKDPETFAKARYDFNLLEECGLITPLRRNAMRGNTPLESIQYGMTPRGHQIAKMLTSEP